MLMLTLEAEAHVNDSHMTDSTPASPQPYTSIPTPNHIAAKDDASSARLFGESQVVSVEAEAHVNMVEFTPPSPQSYAPTQAAKDDGSSSRQLAESQAVDVAGIRSIPEDATVDESIG
jgi:hypothetical protein